MGGFSIGLGCLSVAIVSVEKAFGLKSSGEGDRTKPFAGKDGAMCEPCSPSMPPVAAYDAESGDSECARLMESSLDEPGDALSGFAIRRPPKDWARLRSPSMVFCCAENENGPLF